MFKNRERYKDNEFLVIVGSGAIFLFMGVVARTFPARGTIEGTDRFLIEAFYSNLFQTQQNSVPRICKLPFARFHWIMNGSMNFRVAKPRTAYNIHQTMSFFHRCKLIRCVQLYDT